MGENKMYSSIITENSSPTTYILYRLFERSRSGGILILNNNDWVRYFLSEEGDKLNQEEYQECIENWKYPYLHPDGKWFPVNNTTKYEDALFLYDANLSTLDLLEWMSIFGSPDMRYCVLGGGININAMQEIINLYDMHGYDAVIPPKNNSSQK